MQRVQTRNNTILRSPIWWTAAAVVVVIVLGTVLVLTKGHSSTENGLPVNQKLLASLKHQTNSSVDLSHMAKDLPAPTNHWFSGLALNKEPKAVFPLPLSFKPSSSGFSFGQPVVVSSANTITGGYNPAVTVGLAADSYQVIRYDSLSVTLSYQKAGSATGNLTIAEGSPFISYQAKKAQLLQMNGFSETAQSGVYQTTIGNTRYGLVTSAGKLSSGSLSLADGQELVLFAVPDGTTLQAMVPYAENRVQSVDTGFTTAASTVATSLTYKTAKNSPTLYAALPGQAITTAKSVPGSYQTIYGTLNLYEGTTFSFTSPKVEPSAQLPLSRLSTAEKAQLINDLQSDVAGTQLLKTDSYYGGKELYRAANLYVLATQLGQKDLAASLHAAITAELSQWFDPLGYQTRDNRYFYYDSTVKGLVAVEPSFGSEQFNDHQFHYGYFLYAAAIMSKYDSSFAGKYKPFISLIASDIAAPTADSSFPALRVFDPYFGHSWASGYGQFDDGNNQESSSEALNAWNGLGAWAASANNSTILNQATWMLSRETATAQATWTAPDLSAFAGYAHQLVAINWGGKRDYATFFSADPAAIFGIQLIPLNPSMLSLSSEKASVSSNLSAAVPDGSYDKQFGDYLLMYRALQDPSGALAVARTLPFSDIDDANSRSYMVAWIMSQTP